MFRTEWRVEIPEGVTVSIEGTKVRVSGPLGTLERDFSKTPGVVIELDGRSVVVKAVRKRRKHRANAGTVAAHIRNMVKGVQKPWKYVLRIVYAHFPMKVEVKGDKVVITNLRGAKTPIEVPVVPNTKVEVRGKDIVVTSIDKEAAGIMAGRLETATKLPPEFDPRKFQDGIYIVEKGVWGE